MSLIVFVSTEAGVVVVGDRATTGARTPVGDEVKLNTGMVAGGTKVFAFDNNTVFGVTGIPTIKFVIDGKVTPAFDFASLIMAYGRTHPYDADNEDFWNGLSQSILSELMSKAPPGPAWRPGADGFLFQAMFAHVPRDDSAWSYRCLRFNATFEGESTTISREVVPHPMPSMRAIGNDRVYLEVMDGKDPRFDDVRAEPVIRLSKERAFTDAEAVIFAKRICAVTSQRRLLLEAVDTGHNVSVETDGWLVKTSGWKRLYKNKT